MALYHRFVFVARFAALAGITVAFSLSFAFFARPARADDGEATRLFREGRAALLDGRFDEACPKLEQSQKLDPHVGTLLNVAACHEHQGKVGSAWVEYQKALTAARAEGQSERTRLAEQRIAALEPRVPWLRISSEIESASIVFDGSELARVALGTEMPVDPGVHIVVAERRGAKIFEERIELRESERRTVRVAVTEQSSGDLADPRLVVEPQPTTEDPAKSRPAEKEKGRWILEPGIFLGFLGGAVRHPEINGREVTLMPRAGGGATEITSCASRTCQVGEISEGGSAIFGVNILAGYALSDQFQLGARIIAAPIGTGGASVWALGPSVVLHPTGAIGIGVWGVMGDATLSGSARVDPPEGYFQPNSSFVKAKGGLAGGAFGLGLELSVKLFELGRGSVVANTTPFFILATSGSAVAVPIGIAYRFQ